MKQPRDKWGRNSRRTGSRPGAHPSRRQGPLESFFAYCGFIPGRTPTKELDGLCIFLERSTAITFSSTARWGLPVGTRGFYRAQKFGVRP